MASALILLALGVDEAAVMADYLLSNEFIGKKFGKELQARPDLRGLFFVKPGYLQAGLRRIRKDHGNVESFLSGTLDADLAKLRDLYLEPEI